MIHNKADFNDGPAIIVQKDDYLQLLTPGGLLVAEAKTPNAGRRLSTYAFEHGASSVSFQFDLKKDVDHYG